MRPLRKHRDRFATALCLVTAGCMAAAAAERAIVSQEAADWVTEVTRCWLRARRSYHAGGKTPVSAIQKLVQQGTELAQAIPPPYSSTLLRFRAACHLLLGQTQPAATLATEGLRAHMDTPELLRIRVEAFSRERDEESHKSRERSEALLEIGRIMPLTPLGSSRDDHLSPRAGELMITAHRPDIPALVRQRDALKVIARHYEEMGVVREAIDGYVEHLYCTDSRLFDVGPEERGDLWLRIGDLELRMGQKLLAFRAYLRAAHASMGKLRDPAVKGLHACLSDPADGSPRPKPELVLEKMRSIAALYEQVNLHPFALRALDETEATLGADVFQQRRGASRAWRRLLRHVRSYRGIRECYVLGHEVSKVKDWSRVHILRPSDTFWKPRG